MSLIIDLAPDLGISAEEFVAAWNADPGTSVEAKVFTEQSQTLYFDPGMAANAVSIARDVGVAVAGGLIVELIKLKFPHKAAHGRLKLIEAELSEGLSLIAVTAEKEEEETEAEEE